MATNPNDVTQSTHVQPQSSKETWIERWAMPMLGVPQRHQEVLSDTGSASTLGFQATALVVSSVAFGFTSTLFSHSLLGNSLPASLLMGGVAGGMLFAIDRQTLIDLRLNPQAGRGKAWAVRIATVAMALMMSLLGGVESHKDDISRLQAANAKSAAASTMKSDEYASRVTAAQSSLAQASTDATRKAAVEANLTQARADLAHAEAELARELGGAFDPTNGQGRMAGRGPKAIHWETERDAATRKVQAFQAELQSLGEPAKRQADAQAALTTMATEATGKANQQQQGAAKKLEILFQLLREEWTAWFSLGYGAALALLPEMMLLRAMAPSKSLEDDYLVLNPVERERSRALGFRMTKKVKAEIAAGSKPTIVRVTSPSRKASLAAASPAPRFGPNAGLVGAMA